MNNLRLKLYQRGVLYIPHHYQSYKPFSTDFNIFRESMFHAPAYIYSTCWCYNTDKITCSTQTARLYM